MSQRWNTVGSRGARDGADAVDAPRPPAAERTGATGSGARPGWIFDAEFDEQGFPVHKGGVTPESGLYFVGLPWLTSRGSSFIPGAGPDAERVVADIAARIDAPLPIQTPVKALMGRR